MLRSPLAVSFTTRLRVTEGTVRARFPSAPLFPMRQAFSLCETVIALGIVAFGLVSLLGLMPVGLSTFRSAMDASISSAIVQQVVSDLQQSDAESVQGTVLYFDDQAGQKDSASGALYFVNVVSPGGTPTSIPGGETSHLAKVLVEIVKNPQGLPLERDGEGRVVKKPELTIWCHPVFLSTANG